MNADIRPVRTPAEQSLVAAFAEHGAALPGDGWAVKLRADAAKRFEAEGLPHRRVEQWKWTDLRNLMREAAPLAAPAEAAPELLAGVDATRLVFVNGHFAASLSSPDVPEGVEITRLAEALAGPRDETLEHLGTLANVAEPVLFDLNTAFMTDGAVVRVRAGARVEKPVHLAFVFTGQAAATYTRNLLIVEDGASVTFVESAEGPAGTAYQTNTATELFVGEGAHVRHVRAQGEGEGALHLSSFLASLAGKARLDTHALHLGAAVARNQIGLIFMGEDAHGALSGASLLNGGQHADTTMLVEHSVPHCDSRENFRHVLDGTARAVFQGKIVVRPDAQKTDAKMMAQAMFLAPEAEFDAKPELEIFADDVVCGHGATSGEIDEDQLFYLMARGIPKPEAEALLVRAFVTELLESVPQDDLRQALEERAELWLRGRKVTSE